MRVLVGGLVARLDRINKIPEFQDFFLKGGRGAGAFGSNPEILEFCSSCQRWHRMTPEEDLPQRVGRKGLVGGLVAVFDRINKIPEFQDFFLKGGRGAGAFGSNPEILEFCSSCQRWHRMTPEQNMPQRVRERITGLWMIKDLSASETARPACGRFPPCPRRPVWPGGRR